MEKSQEASDTKKALTADRDPQLREELVEFELDKTHATFFEAGKLLGTALLTYLLLLCLTALLVFGNVLTPQSGAAAQVKVPFLDLTVDKPYAAWIVLILSDMALYWFFSTAAYELVLAAKLYELLDERYKTGWYTNIHLRYPSVFSASFLITHYLPKALGGFISYTLSFLAIVGAFLFHIVLTRQVSRGVVNQLHVTGVWEALLSGVNLLALVPAALAIYASQYIRLKPNKVILEKMVLDAPERVTWKGDETS